ncbi:MAG: hypothetical protein Q9191_008571, partial [Dirinaria sp. TL-2023a]
MIRKISEKRGRGRRKCFRPIPFFADFVLECFIGGTPEAVRLPPEASRLVGGSNNDGWKLSAPVKAEDEGNDAVGLESDNDEEDYVDVYKGDKDEDEDNEYGDCGEDDDDSEEVKEAKDEDDHEDDEMSEDDSNEKIECDSAQ